MDIKVIGMAAVAGLCDAVTEIMTGQPSDEEKTELWAQVENDRDRIRRFYEGGSGGVPEGPCKRNFAFPDGFPGRHTGYAGG